MVRVTGRLQYEFRAQGNDMAGIDHRVQIVIGVRIRIPLFSAIPLTSLDSRV